MLLVAIALLPTSAQADPGDLDDRFGGDGIVRTHVQGRDWADDVLVMADGRIVVVGISDGLRSGAAYSPLVLRYRRGGGLDPTFGGDGKVRIPLPDTTYPSLEAAAMDAAGRILVAGTGRADQGNHAFLVVRLLSDGRLDRSFDGDGVRFVDFTRNSDAVSGVAVLPSGKILLAGGIGGQSTGPEGCDLTGITRLLPDGRIDPTFGRVRYTFDETGRTCATGVALMQDGRAVVSAMLYKPRDAKLGVLRFRPDGELDRTFSGDGVAAVDLPGTFRDVAVLGNGKILVAGAGNGEFLLMRLHPSGELDTRFGNDGIAQAGVGAGVSPYGHELALLRDGRVAVAGSDQGFAAAVFTRRGERDTSFGGDGVAVVDVDPQRPTGGTARAAAILDSGSLLIGGSGRGRVGSDVALVALDT